MAITACREVWRGETWSDSKDGSREYLMIFEVLSDDPLESAVTVRAHPDIPAQWSSYPDDIAALCVDRQGRRDDKSRLLWFVECKFEWTNEEEEDPLDRTPKIRWTSQLFTKPVIKDRNGDACVNSAGDYFDPPLEADVVRWTANIQFNETSIPSNIRSYAGAINQSPITIDGEAIAAERARVIGLDISELQEENDVEFRSITLAIECRDDDDDSFDLEPLDQGFRIKDGSDLKDILIEDEDGNMNRPSAPVLLDGSGGKLSDPSPTTAVFLNFEFPRRADLSIFPGIS